MPVTWNPAWAISAAKGRPTYPRPTTPTLADRPQILSFNSRAVGRDSAWFCDIVTASTRYSIKAPSLDTFYNLDWLGLKRLSIKPDVSQVSTLQTLLFLPGVVSPALKCWRSWAGKWALPRRAARSHARIYR